MLTPHRIDHALVIHRVTPRTSRDSLLGGAAMSGAPVSEVSLQTVRYSTLLSALGTGGRSALRAPRRLPNMRAAVTCELYKACPWRARQT